MATEPQDWAEIIRDVLKEARQTAGTAVKLTECLDELGVRGPHGPYSESAVSNWTKGRTMPPADVLLAALALIRDSEG